MQTQCGNCPLRRLSISLQLAAAIPLLSALVGVRGGGSAAESPHVPGAKLVDFPAEAVEERPLLAERGDSGLWGHGTTHLSLM